MGQLVAWVLGLGIGVLALFLIFRQEVGKVLQKYGIFSPKHKLSHKDKEKTQQALKKMERESRETVWTSCEVSLSSVHKKQKSHPPKTIFLPRKGFVFYLFIVGIILYFDKDYIFFCVGVGFFAILFWAQTWIYWRAYC